MRRFKHYPTGVCFETQSDNTEWAMKILERLVQCYYAMDRPLYKGTVGIEEIETLDTAPSEGAHQDRAEGTL